MTPAAAREAASLLRAARCEGRGANALGGPLTALTWLANTLAADPAGPGLRAGELVTTGVVTGFRLVEAGDSVGADFGDLGRVELRITA